MLNAVRNHPQPARTPRRDVYADYISDAVLAEEIGFIRRRGTASTTSASASGRAHRCSSRTAVAAQTEHLRIGTAVALLPFHDPIRVAEDVAITDILSGGRFDLGVGPGSQYEEFVTFGIDPAEMNQPHVGVDRLHPARVPGEGRVQPQGQLLRHPGHDVHDQAGAEPDPGLVGWDGPAEPAPGGRARLQLHRPVQPRLRRAPRRLRPRTPTTTRSRRCR